MRNERGVALIVTLLVVTLLTIAVVEFTYSVQIDQQMVRNSLSAMQAQLLARSGINLGEALLARDQDDPKADWYFEDWASPDLSTLVQLDPTERLAVEIRDESGKININQTRPRAGQPSPQPGQPNLNPDAFLRDALRRLFESFEIDVDIPDRLLEYWSPAPPAPGGRRAVPVMVQDFRSLEDFGAMFGIPASKLRELAPFVTALPGSQNFTVGRRTNPASGRINVNTAPPEVLAAVLNDQDAVGRVMDRRGGEEPITAAAEVLAGVENQAGVVPLFDVKSSHFRIFSSAMVNADPSGQRLGGVGQTVVALVSRSAVPVPQNAPQGAPRWTLTPLDWQKRGGAEVLVRRQQAELGQDQNPTRSNQ